MLDILARALRILSPGLSGSNGNAILFSVSLSFGRLALYLQSVQTEALPSKAEDTMPQWFEAMDLPHDPSQPLAERQGQASGIYTAIGAQNPTYLRSQLQEAFPTVDFVSRAPPDPNFYYLFIGSVSDQNQHNRLTTLIRKLFPLQLEYLDFVAVEETIYAAICGIAICGTAQTGRGIET